MLRFGHCALALASSLALAGATQAATVYDNLSASADNFHTQDGFNYYLLGDDVTAAPPAGSAYQLNSVSVRLGLQSFSDGRYGTSNVHNYTPSLQLNVYAINPTTRLPLDVDGDPLTNDYLPAIATAVVSNVTFTPTVNELDNDVPNTNAQNVTFTFPAGTVLPTDFAFGYRDNVALSTASDGSTADERNFFGIIGSSSNAAPTVGGTTYGSLLAYANDLATTRFVFNGTPAGVDGNASYGWSVGNNALASVDATLVPVPEPTTVGLLGLGALALMRRRRNV